MTLPIDLQFRGIGRLHLRSGTQKVQVRDAMKAMCRALYGMSHHDLLRDIKAGLVPIQDVYARYRVGRLDQLPSGILLRSLEDAWGDWLDGKEIAAVTRHDYQLALCRLRPKDKTVGDLPRLMAAHRKECRGKRPRTFNKDRAASLSFLQSVVGAHHWLYGEVARQSVLKIPEAVKLPINPLTVEQARALGEKIPPQHLFTYWGILLTGMRPKEWFEQVGCKWTVEGDGIAIKGTKRPASNRVVPRAGEIVRPVTGRLAFYRALRKASSDTVTPYDLRRSYAVWLELAGIPEYRQEYYMAHGPTNMTALYKRQKACTPHLRDDGSALEQVVASPQKSPQSGER